MIDITKYEPVPDKPGYIRPCGTLTCRELNEAILKEMPQECRDAFEWYGIPATIEFERKSNAPLTDGYVVPDWRPGNSEGYVVSLYIMDAHWKQPPVCVWHAKLFDHVEAFRTHLALVRMFNANGSYLESWLKNVHDATGAVKSDGGVVGYARYAAEVAA